MTSALPKFQFQYKLSQELQRNSLQPDFVTFYLEVK